MNDVFEELLMLINLFYGFVGGLLVFFVCVMFILYFIIIFWNRFFVNNCYVSLMVFGLKNFLVLSLGVLFGIKIMKMI